MFIEADDAHVFRQERGQSLESRGPHEAEAGVVVSAFGVVPVWDDDVVEPKGCQHIDPLHPLQGLPDFIYFINGEGEAAHCQRGRASGHEASACRDPFPENGGHSRLLPLAHCVGRTARSHENVIGFLEPLHGGFALVGGHGARFQRDHGQRMAHSAAKVIDGPPRELVRVELKARGCVEKDRPRRPAESCQDLLVNLHHGGREFAGAHEHDHSFA